MVFKVSCVKVIPGLTAKDYLIVWNFFSLLLVDIREHLHAKRSIENQLKRIDFNFAQLGPVPAYSWRA